MSDNSRQLFVHLCDELGFGLVCFVADMNRQVFINDFIGEHGFQFNGRTPVPRIAHVSTHARRHKVKEIVFRTCSYQVKIHTRSRLVRHTAEYIEIDHQGIVRPLKQRVVHDPERLRQGANKTLHNRRVVEVPEHGQHGIPVVAIAVPYTGKCRPLWLMLSIGLAAKTNVFVAFQAVGNHIGTNWQYVPALAGNGEVRTHRAQITGIGHRKIMFRVLEQHIELIVDHVGCDLTTADRAANECPDEILRFIQQEPVTRARRNRCKGYKRIGGIVAGVFR